MTNRSPSPRLSPDQRREQIEAVAARHFERDGVAGASMSAIARDAGVTRPLVYHYFPGKQSLLEAVLQREADRLLVATAPDETRSPQENIERALRAYFAHFAESSGGIRELYAADEAGSPEVTRIAAANHVVQVDRLIAATGAPDTPERRLSFGAWLAFVEFAARHAADAGVGTEQALEACMSAWRSVLESSTAP
ncbi:TetR/AcrR family transcriptional regulator [Demequina soli]|uniref:TetR/AcrR family transcriptional regulator n=1 Tax=Demequina soli TaxID=1638987 RepID=UPI0007830B22|nr:TetR/AcrR family transcriptional regulator [Demequina soli]